MLYNWSSRETLRFLRSIGMLLTHWLGQRLRRRWDCFTNDFRFWNRRCSKLLDLLDLLFWLRLDSRLGMTTCRLHSRCRCSTRRTVYSWRWSIKAIATRWSWRNRLGNGFHFWLWDFYFSNRSFWLFSYWLRSFFTLMAAKIMTW
jgi:hypothetical protein